MALCRQCHYRLRSGVLRCTHCSALNSRHPLIVGVKLLAVAACVAAVVITVRAVQRGRGDDATSLSPLPSDEKRELRFIRTPTPEPGNDAKFGQ